MWTEQKHTLMFAVPVHGPAASQCDCFLQEDLLTVHVTLLSLDPGDIGHTWRVERKGVVGKTGLKRGGLRSLAWLCLIATQLEGGGRGPCPRAVLYLPPTSVSMGPVCADPCPACLAPRATVITGHGCLISQKAQAAICFQVETSTSQFSNAT